MLHQSLFHISGYILCLLTPVVHCQHMILGSSFQVYTIISCYHLKLCSQRNIWYTHGWHKVTHLIRCRIWHCEVFPCFSQSFDSSSFFKVFHGTHSAAHPRPSTQSTQCITCEARYTATRSVALLKHNTHRTCSATGQHKIPDPAHLPLHRVEGFVQLPKLTETLNNPVTRVCFFLFNWWAGIVQPYFEF